MFESFLDVCKDVTKTATKIPQGEYLSSGNYKIFDQGKNYVGGFCDSDDGIVSENPYIVFGDHTRVIKYIDEPCFIGADGVKLLKVYNSEFLPKYVYYALLANPVEHQGYSRHYKLLKEVKIRKADKDLQLAIIDELDTIMKAISIKENILTCLDNLVRSRFIEMFGDVLQNNKDWPIRTFSEIATSRLGKMLDAKQQTGKSSFPYLANLNVQWFRFEMKDLKQMDFDESDRVEFELKDGDLLVCEGGEIGRCAVWHNELQPCYFQKALHRVRCDHRIIHPDYLAWWFKYNCDYDGFASIIGGKATIAHLPGVKLKQLRVVVPPLEMQEQFAAFVEQTGKSKIIEQKQIEDLQELLDSKMDKYFG